MNEELLVLAVTLISIACRCGWKSFQTIHIPEPSESDLNRAMAYGFTSAFAVIGSIPVWFGVTSYGYQAAMAWCAPRVYVLTQIAELVR